MTLHPPSPRITVAVVILLLATVGLGGLLARPAFAADDNLPWTVQTAADNFGADRQDYAYTINPGGQVEDGIVVVNHGTTPLHLALHAADGVTSRAGALDLVTTDATSSGVGAWVHLNRDDVTVPAGESVEVPFVITLPDDAAPGDYAGGIVTSLAQAGEVGIRIRLRVGGALKPSLSVESLRVHYSHAPNPIGKGDATVTYTIHNTGNAILTARQSVSASGPFGRWAVSAGTIADSPPLLPGDTWQVSAPLHGVTPALSLTATVRLVPLLTDAAGSTSPLAATKESGHAWAVPWSLLVAIFVLSGLAVAGLAFRPRRRDRALRGASAQEA
jgi:hypothetical protein